MLRCVVRNRHDNLFSKQTTSEHDVFSLMESLAIKTITVTCSKFFSLSFLEMIRELVLLISIPMSIRIALIR
jgi:hypothetical protein